MTRAEMEKLMTEAGISGHSKLNMRSEAAQKKASVHRIPRIKKTVKKKSKLLLIAELAIPFNPETGMADNEYNAEFKYRPPFSATSVALLLKGMANDNEKTKAAFMNRAGVSEWDTSDAETLTELDKKIFNKYRVPRVFSVSVCKVNIPKMTGNNFGKEFAVNVERDEAGNIVGEWPAFLKVNKLFRDICYEKIADMQKKIDSGEEVLTEQQQKDRRSDFRKEIAVSDDNPSNWVQVIELPLTNKYEISSEAISDSPTEDTIADCVAIHKYNKDIEQCAKNYTSGDLERFDRYFDFYEIDMQCPSEGDDTTPAGKMLLGKDTKFEKPTIPLKEDAICDKLESAVRDYIDNRPDIEETVRRSTYIAEYNQEVENQIYSSLKTVLDIKDNPFVTQKVIKDNQEVILLAYPEEGAELVEELDAGISDKSDGALTNEGSAEVQQEAKYDLSGNDFADDATDNLELENFTMD